MKKQDYILWIPSWYPSQVAPYNGDFIQRHAKAAAIYSNIEVVHVVRDQSGTVTKDEKEEVFTKGNLHETIIYYYVPPSKLKWLERWTSQRKYVSLHKKVIKRIVLEKGTPSLIHAYIALKAGIIARRISRQLKVPFVVSEQSTIYLPGAKPHLSDFLVYLRSACKKILLDAKSIMVVSDYLGKQLQNLFEVPQPVLIPNVVDQSIFHFEERGRNHLTQFIHISTLEYQKNPEDIFRAFSLVKNRGQQFFLHVVGPSKKSLNQLVKQLNLEKEIVFHEEMPQKNLAELMRQADALVLYSRYETFGCVLIEAQANGLPVIVSDIPVIHENVKEGVNGVFAESENPGMLAKKISEFIEGKYSFDRRQISDAAIKNYSYQSVGKKIHDWYDQVTGGGQ